MALAGQTHTPELWQKTVNLKPELVEGWRFSWEVTELFAKRRLHQRQAQCSNFDLIYYEQ